MAELLKGGNGDGPMTRVGSSPKLVERLSEVRAIEEQAQIQLRRAAASTGAERLAEVIRAHLIETEEQERCVQERLQVHAIAPSQSRAANGRAGGIGPVTFTATRPDTPAKLAAHAFAFEHLEIAAYELLRCTAEAAGDAATAAIARQVAAEEEQMAERLASCFDAVVDASLEDASSAGLDDLLDRYLADAHAIEKQGLRLLDMAVRIIDDPELRQLFETHLGESEEHEVAIRERLEARGCGPARARDSALRIDGLQLGACFVAQPDTAARLTGFTFAFEQLEVATYELLERGAKRAGDERVLGLSRRILAEERATAKELAGRWDRAASPASS